MIGSPMLQGAYLSIMEPRTSERFREQVIRFARGRGFDTVCAIAIVDQSPTHTQFHGVHNASTAYTEARDNFELSRIDPVMQHCKRASPPIVWNQDTCVSRGLGGKWEMQARFGFKTGVALALHLPGDRHFFIGADRERPLPTNAKALTRIVADLQLFAVHAHAAFRIFCGQPAVESDKPSLTPRELEALLWTMDGKLVWQVADALNISERTAVFHLRNATRKLGVGASFRRC
jgi:DNA-binding CsgD family transcriptional regulator